VPSQVNAASHFDGRICAAASGMAALALLPAWGAILSLSVSQRSWEPLLWLVGGTLLLTVLTLLSVAAQGRARFVLRGLVCVTVGLLLIEMAAFLYLTLKDMLAFVAGPHYRLARNGVAAGMVFVVLAVVAYTARHGLAALRRATVSGFALMGALPLVLVASYFVVPSDHRQSTDGVANTPVVVLIFDELDDSAIAADLSRLPNFAALGANALSARQMYPPANYTSESLPGMLTGETFTDAVFSRQEVHVRTTANAAWADLSGRGTLFSDAVERRRRTELIGWHLPYCSMFTKLQSCWDDAAFRAPGRAVSLPVWLFGSSRLVAAAYNKIFRDKTSDLNEYSRAFLASPAMYRLHRIGDIFGEQRTRLLGVLGAQRSELVFAHLACPHAPSLDRNQVTHLDMYAAYASNLRECDRLLGDVTTALNKGKYPQRWTLIVTSDHWFRGRDWLDAGRPSLAPTQRRTVPFYLLVAGESGIALSTEILSNSRVLRRLVQEAGEPSFDYAKARALIEAHGDSATALRPF